jgi:endonuclease/exonuclease/phosphatase family metal-dependent hydrolase
MRLQFGTGMARLVRLASSAWIGIVLGLVAVHVAMPQRAGMLALTEVFEPYLVLSALLATPFALIGRTRVAIGLVLLISVFATTRYLPAWISVPVSDTPVVTVATWNVLGGLEGAGRTLEGVHGTQADLIALVEVQPGAARRLQADPQVSARMPYQAMAADEGLRGTGLLSRFPITEQSASADPAFLRAVVELPGRASLVVYVIHPFPPEIRTVARLPVALETDVRDGALAAIRLSIAADIAAGRSVLVAGDFNTTEREPAYADFVRGLRDAHLDAGIGPGLTWRPLSLDGLPFGLVRIDYLMTTPDLQAVSTHVVCNELSDHCLLEAGFR